MMRESWEMPKIAVQQFVAGEYAATICVEVRCLVHEKKTFDPLNLGNGGKNMWSSWVDSSDRGNRYENNQDDDNDYVDEHGGSCASSGNNYLFIKDDGSLGIWEYSHEQKKDLSGVVTYSKDLDKDTHPGLGDGDLIAWITYNASAYWKHWGYLGNQDDTRPNHS